MKYKLFISDFDGTLGGGKDNSIDDETLKAIREYEEKGGKFVVCTGRMFASIKKICDKHNLKGPVVAYQGGVIKDIETGESLFEGGLAQEIAIPIIEKLRNEDVLLTAFIDDKLYYEKNLNNAEYIVKYGQLLNIEPILTDDLIEEIKRQNMILGKLCILCKEEKVQEYAKRYNEKFKGYPVLFNSGAKYIIECINHEHHKGNAVRFLANYYNIPLEQVITIGDSTNDIALIDGEWHGVAVGDAKEQLKEHAKEITIPFKDKPVLHLLKKYCL